MNKTLLLKLLRLWPLHLLLLLAAAALLAPWIAPQNPFDPAQLELMDGYTRPLQQGAASGRWYLLGSDDQGRDLLSATLYGARVSLAVGLAAVAFSLLLGVGLGLLAGYAGGLLDALIMRVADVQLTFPVILVALLLSGLLTGLLQGLLPPSQREALAVYVLVLAIGLSEWVPYARTVRAAVLVEKGRDYVLAARVIGRSPAAIAWHHILPNIAAPITVIATISFALAIIAESTLSYLGVGLPPTTPSLGTLIRLGQGFLLSGEWWILLFPALLLLAVALSVNLLGDRLRDHLNPGLR